MADRNTAAPLSTEGREANDSNVEKSSTVPNDLPDSPRDEERMQEEEFTIDLPDVKDIPGQEFIHAAPLGGLADTTISSADEELPDED